MVVANWLSLCRLRSLPRFRCQRWFITLCFPLSWATCVSRLSSSGAMGAFLCWGTCKWESGPPCTRCFAFTNVLRNCARAIEIYIPSSTFGFSLSTLVQMLLPALSLLCHSLEVSVVEGLRSFTFCMPTAHLPTWIFFGIGQVDSLNIAHGNSSETLDHFSHWQVDGPNCAHCNSSKTLEHLLVQSLFSTLNVLGVSRSDMKMSYFHQLPLPMTLSLTRHFSLSLVPAGFQTACELMSPWL